MWHVQNAAYKSSCMQLLGWRSAPTTAVVALIWDHSAWERLCAQIVSSHIEDALVAGALMMRSDRTCKDERYANRLHIPAGRR